LLKLDYGSKKLKLNIDKSNVEDIISAKEKGFLKKPICKIKEKLNSPIASRSLSTLLIDKDPDNIVIIVNDISRPTPYRQILPPLLDEIHSLDYEKNDVRFLVATGVHEEHCLQENIRVLGESIAKNYEVISHNAEKDNSFVETLSTGNDLYVNNIALKSDFLITTGVMKPHYLAGFSGGRKSILPGVCGQKTIENNHRLMINMFENNNDPAELNNNPIHNEMIEAAKLIDIDFAINVLIDSKERIIDVLIGDWYEAWKTGVKKCIDKYHVEFSSLADLTIASVGGYPRDINLYQAHKGLQNAVKATKEGGTILLIAECRNGFGDETFKKWLEGASKYKELKKKLDEKFVLGGHKAFALANIARNYELMLISSLSKKESKQAFFNKKETIEEVLKEFSPVDSESDINVIPAAADIVPEHSV